MARGHSPRLVYVICASITALQTCHAVPMVSFQTGGRVTADSYLDAGTGSLPPLSELTLLTYIMHRRTTSNIPVLSYAVEGAPGELRVEFVPENKMLSVVCCRGRVAATVPAQIALHTWERLALALDLRSKRLLVRYNNASSEVTLDVNTRGLGGSGRLEVEGGGRLVVGQSLNSVEGDFNSLGFLDGSVADYRLYANALSSSQLAGWAACKDVPGAPSPLVSLRDGRLTEVGDVEAGDIAVRQVCGNEVPEFSVFFAEKMDFISSNSWCTRLGGNLVLPRNAFDNELMWNATASGKNQCSDTWTYLSWLGITVDPNTSQWVGLNDKESLSFSNFMPINRLPSGEFQCAATVSHIKYHWTASSCNVLMCALCNLKALQTVRLRGLCRSSLLDRKFYLFANKNYELVYEGTSHVRILKARDAWRMESRRYENISARVVEEATVFPLGIHSWKIRGDKCQEKEPVLLLTICQSHEFTCTDGSCIPKTKRCDLSLDCHDKSDESDCDRVLIPEGYSTSLPPPKINQEPVPFRSSVLIRTIRSIDIANFKISVDLAFVLMWRDTRLLYRNLQEDRRSNKLNDWRSIWVPSLKITDMTQGSVEANPFNTAAFVVKMAEPVPDDDSTIYEDYMYSGAENYVRYQEEMTVNFACSFDLVMYPFDQQKCYLAFEIHDYDLSLGYFVLEANESRFIGDRHLMEYVLDGERTFVYNDHNASHVAVELKFRNQFLYYVGNVFIPSLMLTILCYVTLFFDEDDFNDRIMVSLTSLLVLVTLFSDSGKSIPKTAYFKLIDVWFISLIWEDFCIILSIIYIEEVRQASLSSAKVKSTSSIPTLPQSLKSSKKRHVRINDIVTWLFAATLIIILAVIIPLGVHGLTTEIEIKFKEMV